MKDSKITLSEVLSLEEAVDMMIEISELHGKLSSKTDYYTGFTWIAFPKHSIILICLTSFALFIFYKIILSKKFINEYSNLKSQNNTNGINNWKNLR